MKKIFLMILLIIILMIAFFMIKTPLAEKNNQKALNFYKEQDFNAAEKYFKRALLWKINDPEILINLSKTLINLGKDNECEQILSKLFRKTPSNAEYYALSGQLSIRKKDYLKGLELLNKAIELDSVLSYAFHNRGIAKANLNDLTGAASDYTKAQEIDKSNVEALEMATSLYVKLENYEASIENYNKLIEINPKNIDAFFQRGTFKMKIGDYKSAINDLSQAIVLSPEFGEAYFNRGKAYAQNSNYKEAISDFEKSISKKFKLPASYFNTGLAWLSLKQPDKAKIVLSKCVKTTENNEFADDAFQLLGTIELMQNNYAKSVEFFNKSITINPANINTIYNRALAYGYMKEFRKAIDDLDLCLGKGMKSGEVYYARAVQEINLQDIKGGCSDLNIAVNKGYTAASELKQIYCK
jgi:tetratricopeptide (TPR) repeat protein